MTSNSTEVMKALDALFAPFNRGDAPGMVVGAARADHAHAHRLYQLDDHPVGNALGISLFAERLSN